MIVIRREIVINAPQELVWKLLATRRGIASWLMPNDFQPVVGCNFALDCGEEGIIRGVVREIDPPDRLVYTFRPEGFGHDTLVTWTLRADGAKTILQLEHSGWPDGMLADLFDTFDHGWTKKLSALVVESTTHERRGTTS